jgi:transglutaminase-like putative cysteine protease
MSDRKTVWRAGAAALFAMAATAATAATATMATTVATVDGERWLEIRLAGEPTGSYHETVAARDGGGGTLTVQEMLLVINRLGSQVRIATRVESSEDAAGHLTAVHSVVSSSQQSVTVDATRTADGLAIDTRAGDRVYRRTLPVSGELLGPEGAARRCREALHAAGDSVSYATFAPEAAAVARVTRVVQRVVAAGGAGAAGAHTADGHTAGAGTDDDDAALVVEERSDATPGAAEVWLDRGGRLTRNAIELPFGKTEMRRTDRAAALRATAGAALPAESYDRTLARSNVRLPDPRSISGVTLRLTHRRPELGWPAFTGPGQRVISSTPTTLVLEVRRPDAGTMPPAPLVPAALSATTTGIPAGLSANPAGTPAAATATPTAAMDADRALAPNALVQSDDSEVVRLAHDLAAGGGDRLAAARALQDWAAAHVEFDLGIALAPASEVVRNRRGTCIAFAVLLAALERAAGIPARIAMGYAYADGIWGGHAWTEVLAGGEWVPLDAALYAPGVADAARFQFGSYTGDDNLAAATAAAAQLYGSLDVQVLAFTAGGRSESVAADAPGFEVAGDIYSNPWLGVSLRKPAAARFAKLDAVFPDAAVVAVAAGGATVEVAQGEVRGGRDAAVARELAAVAPAAGAVHAALDGRSALLVSSADKVRMVAVEGNSLWVLTGTGAGAAELLAQVAEGWRWTPAR